jgi:hypothetical protein
LSADYEEPGKEAKMGEAEAGGGKDSECGTTRIRSAKPHAGFALPVCPDQDAALRACSNGLVGGLSRIGAS